MTRPVSNPDTHHLAQQAIEGSGSVRADGNGWRDISTADKDAAQLMLGIVRRGALEEIHIGGFRYAINEDEVSCWWSDQSDDEIVPTHWHPLPPAPPALSEEKA